MRRLDKECFNAMTAAGLMSTYNHVVENQGSDDIKQMIEEVKMMGFSARIEDICLLMLLRALDTVSGKEKALRQAI